MPGYLKDPYNKPKSDLGPVFSIYHTEGRREVPQRPPTAPEVLVLSPFTLAAQAKEPKN